MNCMSLIGSSARATQCASSSTTEAPLDDDEDMAQSSKPVRFVGEPFIMEAASKVDRCLARLQSLQGTVTIPTAPVSASASACLSPNFSRSRSCLHGSPRKQEDDKIRIHDVLRWSDDFSGKIKQERRDQYLKRLSRSKTEVFDDKKDPLDPHGEWKHWSSPAGDVHKVVSEILMASQIAKQITSMMNAALVQTDVSSDDGKKTTNASHRHATKDTAASTPNARTGGHPRVQQQNRRKDDPLHKFRVVVATDGPVKKRNSSAGSRKEVLYPKSKQPVPDRSRPVDENQVMSSTAKKMQARRSPRGPAVVESRPRANVWAAKEITNRKTPNGAKPLPEVKKVVPAANEKQLPASTTTTLRRGRSSRSPPWNIVEKPKLGAVSDAVKPCFIVKQASIGSPGQEAAAEPTTAAEITSSANISTDPSSPMIKMNRRALPGAESPGIDVVTTTTTTMTEGPFPSAAAPEPLHPTPEESVEPSLEDCNVATTCISQLPSSIPESKTCSGVSSPQQPIGSSHPTPRSNPLIGSLRHKFVMEVTEIKGPNKPWRLNQTKSGKAVLFSNPAFAFAPASPPGARPDKVAPPASPSKSPIRSMSATRRVIHRIGRALSAGRRRSMSPEITQRLNCTRQKLMSLSPGKSLPSLISRLPSRGKRSSSAPRASTFKSPSCTKPAPISGELPIPPGRKAQQHLAAQEMVRIAHHAPAAAKDPSVSNVRPSKGQDGANSQILQPKAAFTADTVMPKTRNFVKSYSGSHWENQVGVSSVLSSCRRWVEESSPPLPGGGGFEKEKVVDSAPRTQKENVVPTCDLSSSRSKIDENVQPAVVGCPATTTHVPVLKRSLSAGSPSFSTGKIRPAGEGPTFLKKAKDWMRTQSPYRDRTSNHRQSNNS